MESIKDNRYPYISIVIPCHNSGEKIIPLITRISEVLADYTYEIIPVDDGSTDNTWSCIFGEAKDKKSVRGIKLSENTGQQTATFAGLCMCRGKWIITMDDDFEHNPEDIINLLREGEKGYDIVYAERTGNFSFLRRTGSFARDIFFYAAFRKPLALKIGSFRIISEKLADKIMRTKKSFIYISAIALKFNPRAGSVKTAHAEKSPSRYSVIKLIMLLIKLMIYYSLPEPFYHAGNFFRKNLRIRGKEYILSLIEKRTWEDGKKVMILGGGSSQVNLIKDAEDMGLHTVVADMNPEAPGIKYSSSFEKASTFDVKAVSEAAWRNRIEAVMTAGTDQPVYISSMVAAELSLPQFLTPETAHSVTNKKTMKNIFKKSGIKTASFSFIKKDFTDSQLSGISPPYVIKPLDSQGQRGVFRLDTADEIREYFDITASFSRENEILVEEYYDSDEITLSGWVNDGVLYILTVTDRVTFENPPTIGICASHVFPSSYSAVYSREIIDTTVSIIENFGIKNGPVYFQYLIGEKGLYVNEIACRLGGAYEDEFIPLLTGINIRKLLIRGSLGYKIAGSDFHLLKPFSVNTYSKYLSVPLIFCREGTVSDYKIPDKREISSLITSDFLLESGVLIRNMNSSTQRSAYAVLLSDNPDLLNADISKFFKILSITNQDGENMVIDNLKLSLFMGKRRF